MFPQQHFKLTPVAAMLAALSVAYPVTGYGVVAGRADFVIGEVEAVAPDGIRRPLAKGGVINAGDAIHTAGGARAQIRFIDGGFVSLQPGSQFRVDEFRYENKADGNEKGFFSLLKGGLRAITGAIGRTNRSAYRVTAKAATIGIRGTGYNAEQEGDGLLVNVGEGAISLTNNAGTLVVTSGESAYVANADTPPEFTFQKPSTPPAGFLKPLDAYFSESEQRDETGGLAILPVALISGPGYALAYAGCNNSGNGCIPLFIGGLSNVNATFTPTSQLIQYDDGVESGALGSANVSFSAADGTIGWGRWSGGTTVGTGPHPLDLTVAGSTFHYVVGLPPAVMPTTGTATYSLIGGTLPTANFELGNLNSGALTADFLAGTVDVNLDITFPIAGNYAIDAPGLTMTGATFSGTGNYAFNLSGCSNGCSTNIEGFFAGANASRAGVAYTFSDGFGAGDVAGVAAFTENGQQPVF